MLPCQKQFTPGWQTAHCWPWPDMFPHCHRTILDTVAWSRTAIFQGSIFPGNCKTTQWSAKLKSNTITKKTPQKQRVIWWIFTQCFKVLNPPVRLLHLWLLLIHKLACTNSSVTNRLSQLSEWVMEKSTTFERKLAYPLENRPANKQWWEIYLM